MNRKNMLIKRAQALIAKHHENLDWDTKVLYHQIQNAVIHMSPDEIAEVLLREISRAENEESVRQKALEDTKSNEAKFGKRKGFFLIFGKHN